MYIFVSCLVIWSWCLSTHSTYIMKPITMIYCERSSVVQCPLLFSKQCTLFSQHHVVVFIINQWSIHAIPGGGCSKSKILEYIIWNLNNNIMQKNEEGSLNLKNDREVQIISNYNPTILSTTQQVTSKETGSNLRWLQVEIVAEMDWKAIFNDPLANLSERSVSQLLSETMSASLGKNIIPWPLRIIISCLEWKNGFI